MVRPDSGCDLCGLPLPMTPIVAAVDGAEKSFCCEGCRRVYQVAADNDMLDDVVPASRPRRRSLDVALGRGETAYFSLDGMWCSGCALAAERALGRRPGVFSVDVSYAAERGRLQYDPGAADPADVLGVLGRMGYDARLLTQPGRRARERLEERMLLHLVVSVVLGMQVMLIYVLRLYPLYSRGQFDTTEVEAFEYAVWALTTPVLFYGGISFLRGAWQALLARTATMDTLVALGTLSAYAYSVWTTIAGEGATYFDSVGMIIAIVLARPVPRGGRRRAGAQGRAAAAHAAARARVPARGRGLGRRRRRRTFGTATSSSRVPESGSRRTARSSRAPPRSTRRC